MLVFPGMSYVVKKGSGDKIAPQYPRHAVWNEFFIFFVGGGGGK